MMTTKGRRAFSLILILAVLTTLAFSSISQENKLRKIEDKSQVCMLQNRTLGRPFIPVVVDGKTYYGCCENCTGVLQQNSKKRYAVDPVTGKEVDKAKAVIGAYPTGEVLYFESEDSLQAFSR